MVREIVTEQQLLSQKCKPAGKADLPAVQDLIDTLLANRHRCVGMAANMIGIQKRFIVVMDGETCLPMLNPVIRRAFGEVYETQEGCLSHEGERPVRRFSSVDVEYQDLQFQKHRAVFHGFTAQIIQHEVDHCNGILI